MAAADAEASISAKVGDWVKCAAAGVPGKRAPKRAKAHTWYRAKAERHAVELDNALRGPFGQGACLADFQMPENWREDMKGPLTWRTLCIASDQASDQWTLFNWMDSDFARLNYIREPDTCNHGHHNDVIATTVELGLGPFLYACGVVLNLGFLPWRDGRHGRVINQCCEDSGL